MTDISDLDQASLPTTRSLVKATLLALVVAAALLLALVLPAEYGIDPSGIGARLGILSLSHAGQTPDAPAIAPTAPTFTPTLSLGSPGPVSVLDAVRKTPAAFRNDEMSLVLAPGEGREVKALMKAGERFFYAWQTTGGEVNVDMHGEKTEAAKDEFSSYWKGRNQTLDHGAFEAPFDGTHGWYWRNRGQTPVTVTVKTSGNYEKLFTP